MEISPEKLNGLYAGLQHLAHRLCARECYAYHGPGREHSAECKYAAEEMAKVVTRWAETLGTGSTCRYCAATDPAYPSGVNSPAIVWCITHQRPASQCP